MEIFNLVFFQMMLVYATPLILASLGGIFSEKTGVVNIALEGIMNVGAFFAVVGTYYTGNPWIGLIFGCLGGAFIGLIHAIACVRFKANQIVSGAAIIIFSTGITGFLLYRLWHTHGSSPQVHTLSPLDAPWLGKIPFVGNFFRVVIVRQSPIVYLALILVFISWFVIYKMRLGLRMRAVGENPLVADSLGINVYRIRFFGVIMSGVLAGLGGAYLSIGQLSQFGEKMAAGRGFIALAAMIFGKWHPSWALGACIFFGFGYALADSLQSAYRVSPEISFLFLMIPFVITMIVLAGVVGKAVPPAADGIPYEKEE